VAGDGARASKSGWKRNVDAERLFPEEGGKGGGGRALASNGKTPVGNLFNRKSENTKENRKGTQARH